MTRVQPYLFLALSLAFTATGCGSSDSPTGPKGNGGGDSCDEDEVGAECTCPDDTESTNICEEDEIVCDCEDSEPSEDEEDDAVEPVKDAGKKDAAKDPVAPVKDAGNTKVDAGAVDSGKTGTTPDAGGDPVTDPGPVVGGTDPKLPEIKGECPEFKDGTIMVAGHKSIVIKAGAAGKGGALVFYWHGTGQSAAEANRMFAGTSELIAGGGILASFNGSQSSKTGSDCSGTGAHNMADFDAADQIAACAVKNHGIDPKRIFTTGCSAGGLQSGCMAQKRSSYIAAAAPNSGGIVFPQAWQDKGTPAIFTMHGGASDMVLVTFSETSASLGKSAKMHGSLVVNCDHGGGHCLAPQALQKSAWEFMKANPYGATDSPWKTAIPAGTPAYCKLM